ncbi:uncharacterized protein LOC111636725 isoform X1 [Centruroides sculpturatus]|uniref:uncharacterized protein LOC111636725 isoform X1 n=1 Tax=Centruroides sculpturatus TaxID=218467 RepID=UPI000C6DCA82|nr:uncharacterized protein LOC111636725 isoform X1 [Centruroides sculpturatus]XP_023237799.1 uncharacterized protein LOC111636725 isoform X1 [Centruroides sculpturatus]XP_023237800.1 uncharacterized protein LOC111636725 isoform X1 [Centruroides sculpturatus]
MIVNFCQLYANSSHILIRPFSSCTGNYLFSYSLIRDKCIKTIFYNISKCISSVAFKNINHYNKLNLNKSLVHIKKRNCNSHSKSENLFYECKNITKLENGVRLNHCSMNYNLLNKINFYRQVNNKINCNLKNILRSYVKYFYYLKNKNLSTMSNDILKLNLILKSKIKKKVNKKKRKLSLLLAGGCLSCKRSKRDEEKLTEEAEELDINQTNKDYGIEKNTCSTFEIDEKLRNDKVKNIILKDDTEATTSSVSESIANESLKQISSKKIEEKNMLVTELPFGNDLCTGSNDDVNDFGSDLLGERQKKKKKVKQKDKKLLIKERTKSHKKRPNHFVAIQVSNPEIKGAIKNIQNHIIQKENILKSTLINVKTLHITLLVFHISNNEELERACSALSNAFEVLKDDLSINPLELTFEGIDHFNNKRWREYKKGKIRKKMFTPG